MITRYNRSHKGKGCDQYLNDTVVTSLQLLYSI